MFDNELILNKAMKSFDTPGHGAHTANMMATIYKENWIIKLKDRMFGWQYIMYQHISGVVPVAFYILLEM